MSHPDRPPENQAQPQLRTLFRLRFTLLFLLVMLLANFAAGTFDGALDPEVLAEWGVGRDSVWAGELSRLVTGTFLSHDWPMLLRQVIFAAAVIGYAEWQYGSRFAVLWFFGLDILGTIALLLIIGWTSGLQEFTEINDVGMSIGGFGLVGIMVAARKYSWAWLSLVFAAIAVKYAVSPDPLADSGHVIALALGTMCGTLLNLWPGISGRSVSHDRR